MSLEAKGTIKLEEMAVDAKGSIFSKYSVKAPTLDIDQALPKGVTSADLAVEEFQRMVKEKVQQDFQRPVDITLIGMSISCSFYIDPIKNRTLDEFAQSKAFDIVEGMVNAAAEAGATVTISRTKPGAD
jgi:hypothetical protein